jgi:two-component system chemotaxis response regulator CheY
VKAHQRPQPKSTVLIVEPDADTRALYCQSLNLASCDIVEAADGREALVKALQLPLSLILTEIRLPFIDGSALCALLRHDQATARVPILVVTGEAREAELRRVQDAGANSVLVKPADLDRIEREMQRLIHGPMPPGPCRVEPSIGGVPRGDGLDISDGSSRRRRPTRSRTCSRFTTTTPPLAPRPLTCPYCDRPLVYERSHIGGVSDLEHEQWDYYTCPAWCGAFQYRHRTRRLRSVP